MMTHGIPCQRFFVVLALGIMALLPALWYVLYPTNETSFEVDIQPGTQGPNGDALDEPRTSHQILFDPDVQDLFRPFPGLFVSSIPEPDLDEPLPYKPDPPPLTLIGIVGQTALIQDDAQVLYFLHPGDEIADMHVIHVEVDHVVARQNDKPDTLTFSN